MSDFPLDSINFISFMRSEITNKMHTREFEGNEILYLPFKEFLELSTNISAWLDHLENIDNYFERLFASDPGMKDVIIRTHSKIFLIAAYSNFSPESLANVISNESLLLSEDERRRYFELSLLFYPVKFIRGIYLQIISAGNFDLIKGIANEDELGTGAAGRILRIQINSEFHNVPAAQHFALKCFDTQSGQHAEREAVVLKKLMPNGHAPHPHISEIYCGFHSNNSYFLIAELA